MTVKVGIIGVTGYTGGELLRILTNHPQAEVIKVASRSNCGNEVSKVHQHLLNHIDLVEVEIEAENFADCDVVFLALPHGTSSLIAKELVPLGVKVIDLGADFRLKDLEEYKEWYSFGHSWPEALADCVYGLPELYKKEIKEANLIANPGCYPTTAILGLAPLLAKGWVEIDSIVIDSKSGVSGAGKGLTQQSHFPDMNENFTAYKIAEHRHTPEIEQELSMVAGEKIMVTFNPHLAPLTRGMLSTITVKATEELNQELIDQCYQEYYQDQPFVRVRDKQHLPQTKWVMGSNYCDVAAVWDQRTKRIVIMSAIDNLVKGASGQAIQNMNIMMGLDETAGLKMAPLYP